MVETEQYKELSRVPRTLSELNNGASLDLLIAEFNLQMQQNSD